MTLIDCGLREQDAPPCSAKSELRTICSCQHSADRRVDEEDLMFCDRYAARDHNEDALNQPEEQHNTENVSIA